MNREHPTHLPGNVSELLGDHQMLIHQSQSSLEAEEAVATLCELVDDVLKSHRVIEERLRSMEGLPTTRNDAQSALSDQHQITTQHNFFGFAFEEELNSSWVYKRTTSKEADTLSIVSAAGRTASWSMISGLSLSYISDLSIIALPVYANDLANREYYKFGDPGDTMLVQRPVPKVRVPVPVSPPSDFQRTSPTIEESTSRKVFQIELSTSIGYANILIPTSQSQDHYIPVIVGKCAEFLIEKGQRYPPILCSNNSSQIPILTACSGLEEKDIFRRNGFPPRIEALCSTFDNEKRRFGKEIDWTGYTVFDCASCLLRYLKSLPATVIPYEAGYRFRRIFSSTLIDSGDPENENLALKLKRLILTMPYFNTHLLLFLLDLLASFAVKADINGMSTTKLVEAFQPSLLVFAPSDMLKDGSAVAVRSLVFMVEHRREFQV